VARSLADDGLADDMASVGLVAPIFQFWDRPSGEKVAEFDAFLNRMQVDDIVVTTSGGTFYVGRVAGDAVYIKSDDDRSNLRRAVAWANADSPIDFSDLPDALTVKLSSQHAIVDLTNEIASLENLLARQIEHDSVKVPLKPTEAKLPDATDEYRLSATGTSPTVC